MRIDFCDGWTCSREDGKEKEYPVTLPHDAMLREKRVFESKGGKNIGWYEGGDYIYEKAFEIPHIYDGQMVILEFEGVYHNAEVFVNGRSAGKFQYGYSGFFVYVDSLLKSGINKVTVIARNGDQPNCRWYTGTGIYRPVNLYILPEKHFLMESIRISTLDWKTRKIRISAELSTPGTAKFCVMDDKKMLYTGNVTGISEVVAEIELKEAELWSCNNPKMYTLKAIFGEQEEEIPFGIRQINVNSREGFCINGERVILRGACIHHDNGILGACAYADAEARKVRLMKNAGYNALRSAHNPCSKALLEACDRQGMLVMDEYVDVWYIHKTRYDYAGHVEKNYRKDLGALVRKDYNHPSVVLYSLGNEVAETSEDKGIRLCSDMRDYLHDIDRTRPVTCGVNLFFNFLYSMGFGVYSDEKAEKEPEKEVGSAFYNKLASIMGDSFMKFGAWLPVSDIKTRDAYANMDIAGYNYGIWRYKKDVRKYSDRVILGTETFCADVALFWELANKYPAVIGDFVWSGITYHGEVPYTVWKKKGRRYVFTESPDWAAAGSGRLDMNGREWSEADYTKVVFGRLPIAIGVVPLNLSEEKYDISAWDMTCALGSWSWNGYEGKKTKVEVYSRANSVELFLNGKSLGRKKLKRCKCAFKVNYVPGMLEAVAYTKVGKQDACTKLCTAGDDTMLSVMPEEGTKELYFVNLRYTDHQGILKPLEKGRINVRVEGGELLALGSARPLSVEGYLTDSTDTYYGEAMAVIRPLGVVKLYVQSPYGKQELTMNGL